MNILIIDRQELVRKHLDNFLCDSGHRTVVHESMAGLNKSKAMDGDSIDVIMIDPGPTTEGAEKVIGEIHALFPRADILMMDHATLKSSFALANNVFAYLKKPVRLAEVELLLARIAEKRNWADN